MQELIDYMKTYFHLTDDSLEMFDKALEKEKEQIIIAYIHNRYVLAGGHPIRRDSAEDYYNQTYNQNKETNNLCQLTSIVQDVVIAKEDLTIS